MDTKTLIKDAKARFSHNSAKAYLKEKYNSKLVIAEQGGLWRADAQTIALLQALSNQFTITTVLVDTFDNPVEVEITSLLAAINLEAASELKEISESINNK